MFGGENYHEHFTRIYLQTTADQRIRHRVHSRNWVPRALAHARRFGMSVISGLPIPESLEKLVLRVPQFVSMSVDLCPSEADFRKTMSSSGLSDLRLIKRGGYDYSVHRNSNWAVEFYNRFHEKGIASRHGSEGLVMQCEEIAECVAKKGWEFVCVTRDGRCLAACLGGLESSGYRMARLGWLEGNPTLVKEGVLSAVYWFAMRRARELGAQRILLGGSPPYLEDGLFRYKAKWNAALDAPNPAFNVFHLLLDPTHPSVRAMLMTRSIVALGSDDQFVVYSSKDPKSHKLSPMIKSGIARWYRPACHGERFSFLEVPDWQIFY